MSEGNPAPDLLNDLLFKKPEATGGTAPLPLFVLGQLGPIDFGQDETSGVLQDTSNQHLGAQQLGLGALDPKGMSAFGINFTDLFSRLIREPTDNTGGTGGDSEGGGGGGGSSDSGVAPSEGGDSQGRAFDGNFEGLFQGMDISDGGFIGKPSDVPDVRGGGEGASLSMD
jgi:hypothetical protein